MNVFQKRAVWQALIAAVLLLLGFFGGLIYDSDQPKRIANARLQGEKAKNMRLVQQNDQLKKTLELVKRQIQTDRIAYQALQETIASSEKDRQILKQKLERQRALLQQLNERLQ